MTLAAIFRAADTKKRKVCVVYTGRPKALRHRRHCRRLLLLLSSVLILEWSWPSCAFPALSAATKNGHQENRFFILYFWHRRNGHHDAGGAERSRRIIEQPPSIGQQRRGGSASPEVFFFFGTIFDRPALTFLAYQTLQDRVQEKVPALFLVPLRRRTVSETRERGVGSGRSVSRQQRRRPRIIDRHHLVQGSHRAPQESRRI